jgi:tetratricopeptide (TPR) repeat protein
MTANCPRCGAGVAEDARFCSQCGAPLDGGSRRRHRRLPARVERPFGVAPTAGEPELEVEWQRGATWQSVESSLVNVSRGGLGLVCDESIPVGSALRARLTSGDQTSLAEGTVVYCAPLELFSGVPCFRCGIAFEGLQDAFVAALAGPASGVGYLVSLGDVAAEQGDRDSARAWYLEALQISRELAETARVPRLLENLAMQSALDGDAERALRLAGAAAAIRDEIGIAITPAQHARIDGALGAVQWGLGQTARDAAWAVGRAMGLDEAISYALAED